MEHGAIELRKEIQKAVQIFCKTDVYAFFKPALY